MDELNPNNLENFDKIETVDLQVEMARSYLDYAMSVIVGREPFLVVQHGYRGGYLGHATPGL